MATKTCPKCGKKPRIAFDLDLYEAGFGGYVTVQCKPFLRKPHLKIEVNHADANLAKKKAIEEWNRQVDKARE